MHTSFPPGGPDALLALAEDPPSTLLLVGSTGLQIVLAAASGSITATPEFWNGFDWVPFGDASSGTSDCTASAAGVAVASVTIRRPVEPVWCAVKASGGGTAAYCTIAEVEIP